MRTQLLVAALISMAWSGLVAHAQPGSGFPPGTGGSAGAFGKKKGSSGDQVLDTETVSTINEWADNEFRRFDKNGDGKLNSEEMPPTLRLNLDKWDKNGDGVIDVHEYRAYFLAKLQGNAPGMPPQPGAATPPRVKWEYHVEPVNTADRQALQVKLNKLGADGWELVAIDQSQAKEGPTTMVLRRPLAEKQKPAAKRAPEPGPNKPEPMLELRTYALKHASATDLVGVVKDVLEPNQFHMRIVAEQRTNQLIVNGPMEAQLAVQTLLNQLDVPTEQRAGPNRPGGPGGKKKE